MKFTLKTNDGLMACGEVREWGTSTAPKVIEWRKRIFVQHPVDAMQYEEDHCCSFTDAELVIVP